MEYGLVALWLLTYLAFLYLGMPLARAIVPDLEDFGAGVALPLALAVLWLVVFTVGRLSITVALWLGLLVLGGLSALLWYRGYEIDHEGYVRVALVFSVAFCFVIAIRAVDPAAIPGGGEKFLDMSLLQSSLRGTTVPPEDAWFAGETVRYYYGGHMLASLLARITGTEARFAYNLALAGFYGMVVTAAYGLGGSIAAHRGFSARRAGLASAFFVGFASNLLTTFRFGGAILEDAAGKLGLLGAPLELLAVGWYWIAGLVIPLRRDWGLASSLTEFDYWPASRVIENAITEFPLFAWLHGDLHAHMMSTPFLLVVCTVLLQVFVAGTDRSRRRTLFTVFGVLPALGAIVAVVNTWSFPAVGGLVVLTLALGPAHPLALLRGSAERASASSWVGREGKRIAAAVGLGVAVLAIAGVFSAPYWLFESSTGNTGLGLLPDQSTLAEMVIAHGAFVLLYWLYLSRHGRSELPTPVAAGGVAALVVGTLVVTTLLGAPAVGLFVPVVLGGWALLRRHGTRPAADTADGPTSAGFETVLLVALAGLILLVEFVYVDEPGSFGRFNTVFKVYMQVWILAGVTAGVVLTRLLEERHPTLGLSSPNWQRGFAALEGVLVTVLSLYGALALTIHFGLTSDTAGSAPSGALSVLPAWAVLVGLLLVLAIVWSLATLALDQLSDLRDDFGVERRAAVTLAVGLLVVMAGLYGTLGVASTYAAEEEVDWPYAATDHERIAEPTLDSLAFVERFYPDEAEAIYWLDREVEGQPNMVSAPGPQYEWYNAPASLTGVPTVAGKPPERSYRGPEIYDRRVSDVRTIYSGAPADQRRLLKQYDVELIYVGPNERSTLAPFTFFQLDAVSIEKSWDDVTIYRVDQQALETE
jgi:YYY domain-containing protein